MKSKLLKLLPHAVAVLVFVVIATSFFSLLSDEIGLKQPDFQKVMGMAKETADYRLMNGDEALWSNNMFGGMPAYQTNVIYPSNLIRGLSNVITLNLSPPEASLFMCMLGMYILMLCLRVNPWLGIVAGISFGLSTINIMYIGGGHITKVNAIAYMAPVLGGLILAFRGKWLFGSVLFMLFMSLQISANHLQMTYYLAFLVAAVAIAEAIRLILKKEIKYLLITSAALIVGGVISVMPNAGNMLTTYEYSKFTTRGKTELTVLPAGREESAQASDGLSTNYILEYNMSAGEPWAMVIPNAKGGSSSLPLVENKKAMQKAPRNLRENLQGFSQYWGDQGSSAGAFYFGAGMMFLFALALIFSKDTLRWPFLIITVLSILLCMKDMHALNDFFINKFPMYNKFRDSKMILVLIQVMAPAFGILFIDGLIKNGVQVPMRKFLLGGIGALVVIVIVLIASPSITGPLISQNEVEYFDKMREQYKSDAQTTSLIGDLEEAMIAVRKEVFAEDAQRSLMIILVMAGLAVVAVFGKLKWYLFAAIGAIVVTADMWLVSSRYMNEDKEKDKSGKMVLKYYQKNEDRYLPYEADKCDDFILMNEKTKVSGFDEKVATLENKMLEREIFANLNKEKVHKAAEFGTLNLNTNFRVLLANRGVFSESGLAYFHKSIGGYHAAKLKRYQELIDFYLYDELDAITNSFKTQRLDVIDSTVSSAKVLSMLNTRYVKYSADAPPLVNKNALGNAWFVSEIRQAQNDDEEMLGLKEIDLKSTALVNQEFIRIAQSCPTLDSTATVEMTEYGTKRLTYKTNNNAAAPLIFSEIYYPAGWICRIDGNVVPDFRANYILRGVMVPAGQHTVEWSFEPATYSKGVTINWIGSFLVLGIFLLVTAWSVFRAWKKDDVTVNS